jgi:hypothetical protein
LRRILLFAILTVLMIVPSGVSAQAQYSNLASQLESLKPKADSYQESVVHLPEVTNAPVDGRVQAVEALLARYNAPIQGLGQEFVQVADRDGYDWRMLVSIAGIESSFGLHQLGYNLFGWGGGQTRFASFADSIDQVSRGLAAGYISHGRTTPEAIQPVYCPPNPAWAAHVRSFMAQLGS